MSDDIWPHHRAARGSKGRRTHDYHTCRDPECYLPYCRIWREAREEIERAYMDGFRDGEAAGFSAGFSAGMAAAGAR